MIHEQNNVYLGERIDRHVMNALETVFNSMCTCYGPSATDSLTVLSDSGSHYLTRDGKQILTSIATNNSNSMAILKIIKNVIDKQARVAGDGTTTAAIFLSLLTRIIQMGGDEFTAIELNNAMDRIIPIIADIHLTQYREIVDPKSDTMLQMIHTCCKDEYLTEIIMEAFKDANEDSIVDVRFNHMSSETSIEKITDPTLEISTLYKSSDFRKGTQNHVHTFLINGTLSINFADTFVEVLKKLGRGHELCIIVTGLAPASQTAISHIHNVLSTNETLADLSIFSIRKSKEWLNENLSYISMVVSGEEICGVNNPLLFEAYLNSFLENPVKQYGVSLDISLVGRVREELALLGNAYVITASDSLIIRRREERPKVTELIKKLKEAANNSTDESLAIKAKDALRDIFGSFITIKVGANDDSLSSSALELIKDGIKNAVSATDSGISKTNGTVALSRIAHGLSKDTKDASEKFLYESIALAASASFALLPVLMYGTSKPVNIDSIIDNTIKSNICHILNDDSGEVYDINSTEKMDFFENAVIMVSEMGNCNMRTFKYQDREILATPTEPIQTMQTIINNMKVAVSIAKLQLIVGNNFHDNFI